MKTLSRFLLLGLLAFVGPVASFAASNEVLLVFSANTELNRHLYSLLGGALSSSYKVTATLSPATAKPGVYKAVIVFSTRATSGLEPSLAAFIKGYPAPAELYLVSLLSRSSDYTVTAFAKGSSPAGVDGITAATAWNYDSQAMHNQWVQILLKYLKSK